MLVTMPVINQRGRVVPTEDPATGRILFIDEMKPTLVMMITKIRTMMLMMMKTSLSVNMVQIVTGRIPSTENSLNTPRDLRREERLKLLRSRRRRKRMIMTQMIPLSMMKMIGNLLMTLMTTLILNLLKCRQNLTGKMKQMK